ncbi:sugar-binding domain-containing protein [Saccharicrinis aurantiacus]|uniref:sugar-binding domain-containing protein n=1 Tax=Saccharicrinis aurantiacus TaxID=1849719 RepID=UPI0024915AFF|nr:sugar-binding domain-containing protein [Saccharicrinis aurantiacus]
MKSTLCTALILLCLSAVTLAQGPRSTEDFNFDWKFLLGDAPEAVKQNFDDSAWRTLNLPHDWSIEQSYTTEKTSGSTGFLPTGIGWYRKTFEVPANWENTVTNIEFDGIYNNSKVWINGHYLGKRPYGYSVFGYELSAYLNYGGSNTITVKVDHEQFADSRWYTGSGIYRNVRLINTATTYIPQFGAWIETPLVSEKKATVDIHTVVKTTNKKLSNASVKAIIKDGTGKVIAQKKLKCALAQLDTFKVSIALKNPKLWSIETPNLYTAEIEIIDGKTVVDNYSTDFGIRSIRFDANTGFYLNEKPVKMKGVCLHHDAGAVGAVFIKDVWARRLNTLQEIGVNAIRCSHNPADPGLLKLCDEMGFLVINEAFDEWKRNKQKWNTSRFAKDVLPENHVGYGDIFEEWAERDAKDMIRATRNHPSIIMWSMGNEIEWTYPYYWKMEKSTQGLDNQVLIEETGSDVDELKETAELIQKWFKEVDTTRFVTTGGVLPKAGNMTGYFDVPDVIGYNYRAINYDEDHKNYPNRIMYGSENWGTYQEWKDIRDRDFMSGIFLWTGIAYLGESGPFPWKGLEISLLDFCGFYTPRGHFFRTLWSDKPYTYLATKHAKKAQWIYSDGKWVDNRVHNWLDKWLFDDVEQTWNYKDGDSVFVEVFSNSPQVELFVNNKSYGIKSPADFEDNIVKYLVPYAAGEIKAVGINQEKAESDYAIKTAKWVGKIVLKADKTEMKANGYDVVHIEAFVQTKNGDLIPDLDYQFVFKVEGNGVNIGVDNGWDRNVQKHKSNYITTHNGRAMMLVQSTREAGVIKVSAKSGNFESNEIIIKTVE